MPSKKLLLLRPPRKLKEFAERALQDISFTDIFGMFSVGKAPFVAQHERIFSTIYKDSTNPPADRAHHVGEARCCHLNGGVWRAATTARCPVY
jgi:hypothetical protein